MDRYCVMGNPVDHSKSPWIHARFAALTGQRMEYGKRLVPMDGFADGVRAFRAEGGKGCNVTVPFKFEAASLADFRSARALLAGACNVLRFEADGIHGENTDGIGLVADVQRNAGVSLGGRDVLLLALGALPLGLSGCASGGDAPVITKKPEGAWSHAVVYGGAFLAAMGLLPPVATVSGSIVFKGCDLLGLSERELNRLRGRRLDVVLQLLHRGAGRPAVRGEALVGQHHEHVAAHDRRDAAPVLRQGPAAEGPATRHAGVRRQLHGPEHRPSSRLDDVHVLPAQRAVPAACAWRPR